MSFSDELTTEMKVQFSDPNILQVKKNFSEQYDLRISSMGKPHISLVNFLQYEMMEERIIYRLRLTAMGHHAFKIELKDFGSFPNHTIFINVTSKPSYQELVKDIRQQSGQLMKLNAANRPHFIMEPYIPLARRLQPHQYEKGWLEYSHKHFSAGFIAEDMLLLKRPEGSNASYQVVQRFEFMNLPVNTVQGELFGG